MDILRRFVVRACEFVLTRASEFKAAGRVLGNDDRYLYPRWARFIVSGETTVQRENRTTFPTSPHFSMVSTANLWPCYFCVKNKPISAGIIGFKRGVCEWRLFPPLRLPVDLSRRSHRLPRNYSPKVARYSPSRADPMRWLKSRNPLRRREGIRNCSRRIAVGTMRIHVGASLSISDSLSIELPKQRDDQFTLFSLPFSSIGTRTVAAMATLGCAGSPREYSTAARFFPKTVRQNANV